MSESVREIRAQPASPVVSVESESEGPVRLCARGDLRGDAADQLWSRIEAEAKTRPASEVVVDFDAEARVDSATVAALVLAHRELGPVGQTVRIGRLNADQAAAFRMIPPPSEPARSERERPPRLARIGFRTHHLLTRARLFSRLARETSAWLGRALIGRARFRASAVVDQSVIMGVDALALVLFLSFVLGLVLSMQALAQLRWFGAEIYMADIVGVGMVREFGPILTGMIFAGRNATGIAAEIGTMAVREELDALRTMGVDPIELLVAPRLLALLLIQPVLTIFSMAAGIGGGFLFASFIGISETAYLLRLSEAVMPIDLASGIIKSVSFAAIVALSGAFMGLWTRGGATSVGRSTTSAVVTSISLIVVLDSVITGLVVWLDG